jgi:hypothetical protein
MKGWERVQGIGKERRKKGKGFESGLWNAAVEGERGAISGCRSFHPVGGFYRAGLCWRFLQLIM